MLFKSFIALVAALVCGSAVARGSANDVVMVRAEVRPSAVLKFEVQSPELKISDADIEIGFIDLAAGSLFRMSAGRLKPVITVEFAGDAGARSVEFQPENGSYRLKLADLLAAPADSTAGGSGGTKGARNSGPLLLSINF